MDVFLDNDPFATPATALGEIINAGRDAAEQRGRIIVEVRVDGRPLAGDELGGAVLEAAPDGTEVQLITADPRQLAKVVLGEVHDALSAAKDQQQRASELLSADQTADAHEPIRSALGAWDQAQQAVGQIAALLEIDLDELTVDGKPAGDAISALADQLGRVLTQMNAADWIGLADTLAYELGDTADRWIALVDTMAQRIEKPATDAPDA